MATKCFLRRTAETTGFAPTPDAGWEETSSIVRAWLRTATSGDSHADVTITETNSTDRDVLARQYIAPLKAGQTITGGQAVQFVARFQESTSNNNMHSVFGIRVVNIDGTVKKTVLAVTREANEMVASPTTATARNNTATSAATNYTTVAGDFLVVEIGAGGDPSGSSPHTYVIGLGDNAGTFLAANDTETTANDPWVQLADTLIFEYSITSPNISSGAALNVPTVANTQLVTGATISSGASVNAPTVAYAVTGAHIASGAAISAPTVAYNVVTATISSGAALSAPEVELASTPSTTPGRSYWSESYWSPSYWGVHWGGEEPISGRSYWGSSYWGLSYWGSYWSGPGVEEEEGDGLTGAFIASGSVVYAPTLANAVTTATISSGSTVSAPTVAYAVTTPTITSGATLGAPTLAYAVTTPTIDSTATLYPGSLLPVQEVTTATIASGSAVYAPTLTYAVTTATISAGSALYAPTVAPDQPITTATISSGSTLAAPVVAYVVDAPTITSGSALYAPVLAYAVTTPTITSGAVYAPTLFLAGSGTVDNLGQTSTQPGDGWNKGTRIPGLARSTYMEARSE